ncbi:MAG: AsmA family protein [Bacteroidaceae bacterium]|nr:AsmA family protein [Bacteroidaceae bacterium]
MKKFLKITAAVIAVIVLLLVSLPLLFTDKIEALIKEEGNKMLNAKFDFESLDISLIRNFPLASVTLEDFYLKGAGVFENDTLVAAGELTASVNLMSLFGDEGYDIREILIDEASVKAIVLADGTVNWDIMKAAEEEELAAEDTTATAPFRIKLQELAIRDFNLVYDDKQGNMYACVEGLNATCSGDFGSSRTILSLDAETEGVTFSMEGVPFLSKAVVAADMKIDADLENSKFTLNENTLQLNAIKAAIDGWVAMTSEGMDMDLKLNSNKIGFKEILSLIPAIYSKDFEGLRTDGNATLTAWAKGSLQGDSIVPAFDLAFDVENAMFQYPSLPAGVNNINIAAQVNNPGGSPDNTVIKINPFNFVMAGNPFSVTATMQTPMSDLAFNAAAKGKLDLGKIKDIYPLEDMQLNGVVNADLAVKGRMSHIEKEQYEKIEAAGNVRLNDMILTMEDMPNVDIKKSLLTFTPRYLQLSETTVKIGGNDVTVDSRFENYMAYALKDGTLKGTLNVKSNHFNLNDFMTPTDTAATAPAEDSATADTVATGVIKVPDNIDFRMQAAFREVLLDNMKLKNVNGLLVVKNSKVDMQNLSLNTMGGDVVVNGYYYTPVDAQPVFNGGFKLSNIGFAQAYEELNVVRNLAPIFSGLTGDFSGNVNIDAKLDDTMSPVLSTLTGSGALSTKDLSLNNVGVIQTVADIVQKPSLKDTRVKDMNIEFTIKDGRVNTRPFDIKLGDYKMNLSGSTGLDQTIDYKGEITIPTSVGKLSKLGTVDMNIKGTFTSPKVSIDMASLAKKAAAGVAENALNKLLGGSISKTGEGETADSTATTTPASKAEVANKLINGALDLFKKKK